VSINMMKGFVKSGCQSTGLSHILSYSVSNVICCCSSQCQGVVFYIRSSSGWVMHE
jgi:hypothetical protein